MGTKSTKPKVCNRMKIYILIFISRTPKINFLKAEGINEKKLMSHNLKYRLD